MNTKKNTKKNTNTKTIRTIGENENKIAEYNGSSVRKMADAWRETNGVKFPVIYKFCSSTPVRAEGEKRVLVEGRFECGCIWNGKKERLSYVFALLGYKLPCGGTPDRCDELIADYKDAIAQRGKYAPKAPKASK